MQVLGYEVDTINSVQLSNHTQYDHFKGQVLNAEELRGVYDGLRLNKINNYSHLLTGYCGSESFLLEVVKVVKELKEVNPNLIYVCDPVMGDNGHFYVPEILLPVYQKQLLPLADLITPNTFEAELLSGKKISNEAEALEAMQVLHDIGVKTVVLSSVDTDQDDKLITLATSVKDGKKTGCRIEFPKISCQFTGTGDLFTALLLVWTHKHPDNLQLACEKTLSSMQAVLSKTDKHAQALAGEGNKPNAFQRELRMVQSKVDIENPTLTVKGSPLS
ncbi:pyridoxal kinase-like isoform X5 [Amphiura filiformis]